MRRIYRIDFRFNMFVIVSYDVVDNKQRTKLAKKMCNYGERVQYSVFECRVNKQQYKEMKREALKFIDLKKDSLRIYRLCQECIQHIESFGIKRGMENDQDQAIIV
jgi:CRISPR-associated protein Cas2